MKYGLTDKYLASILSHQALSGSDNIVSPNSINTIFRQFSSATSSAKLLYSIPAVEQAIVGCIFYCQKTGFQKNTQDIEFLKMDLRTSIQGRILEK